MKNCALIFITNCILKYSIVFQADLEESEIKLQDAKAEIERLNLKMKHEAGNEKLLESQYESLSANFINVQADLEQKEESLKKFKTALKDEQMKVSHLEKESDANAKISKEMKQLKETMAKLKNSNEIKQEEISSLTLSLEAQQKLIAEKETEVMIYKQEKLQAEQDNSKMDDLQDKLTAQDDEIAQLKHKEEAIVKQNADNEKLIGILRSELDPLQENAKTFKEKYEALSKMVEPFREQLESFEVERNALLAQNKQKQSEMSKLASEYAKLLGHQNHKQKIHHLVRIKQENLDMREEIAKLNVELSKHKRMVTRLKESKNHGSKENVHPGSALSTPLNKTGAIRRQTIASPLANRNGQR